MGSILAAALLLIDPSSARVDVSGGVAAEVRGGRAPISPVDPPVASFLAIVTPDVAMQVRSRRGGVFTLGYSPRIQYRLPNRLDLLRPLFLHTFTSTYDVSLSRRWSMGLSLSSSVGEVDYTGINIALGDNAAAPDLQLVNFVFGSGGLQFTNLVNRRNVVSFGPEFDLRSPLGDSRDLSASTTFSNIPTQTAVYFPTSWAHQASTVDTVDLRTRPGIVDYDSEDTYVVADTRVGWDRQVATNLFTRLDAGLFVASLIRGEPGDTDLDGTADTSATRVFPVGSVSLQGRLRSTASHWVDGNLGFEVIGFFDRVAVRVDPRGQLTAGITTTIPPRWAAGLQAAAFTALNPDPRPSVGMNMIEVPETLIRVQTPITYAIGRYSALEFGAIVSVRASHLASSQFQFTQLELWGYLAYRIGAGTARGQGEVGGRGDGPIGTGTQGIGANAASSTRQDPFSTDGS